MKTLPLLAMVFVTICSSMAWGQDPVTPTPFGRDPASPFATPVQSNTDGAITWSPQPVESLLKTVKVQFAGTNGVEIGWKSGQGVSEWAASQVKVPAVYEFETDATYSLRVNVPIGRAVTMDCDLIIFPVTEKTRPYLEENAILFEINRLMGHAMQHGELKQTLILPENQTKQTFLISDNTENTAKIHIQLPQYPDRVLGVIHVKGFTQHHDRSLGKSDRIAPYKLGDHQYGLRRASPSSTIPAGQTQTVTRMVPRTVTDADGTTRTVYESVTEQVYVPEGVSPVFAGQPVPAGPQAPLNPAGRQPVKVQVNFTGPEGMRIGWQVSADTFTTKQLAAPARYDFDSPGGYRLVIENIPGHEGLTLHPLLWIARPKDGSKHRDFLTHDSIPLRLTGEDIDQFKANNFVTKVFYLPDHTPQTKNWGLEEIVSTRLDPGIDPFQEADKRGVIVAVFKLTPFNFGTLKFADSENKVPPVSVASLVLAAKDDGTTQYQLLEHPIADAAAPQSLDPYAPNTPQLSTTPTDEFAAELFAADDPTGEPQPEAPSGGDPTGGFGDGGGVRPFGGVSPGVGGAGGFGGNPFGGGFAPGAGGFGTGGGGFGGVAGQPIPFRAAPAKNSVMSANIVVSLSDDGKTLWGYSKSVGRWTRTNLSEPLVNAVPVVGDSVGCFCSVKDNKYGNIVWAFSGGTGRWDKLELAAEHAAVPQVNQDMIVVEDDGKLHIFSDATGQWASQDELLANAQVQGDPAGDPYSLFAPVSPAKPASPSVKVFRLQYSSSGAILNVLSDLYGGRDDFRLASDARTNSLIVSGPNELLDEFEALVSTLDEKPSPNNPAGEYGSRGSTPQEAFQNYWRGGDGGAQSLQGFQFRGQPGDAAELTREYQRLNEAALAQAEQLRGLRATAADPAAGQKAIEARKNEVRDEVAKAFDARQQQQQAQVAELVQRLQSLQATIDAREKIRDRIIDRRVEELLDPNLKWETPGATSGQNLNEVWPLGSQLPNLTRPVVPATGSPANLNAPSVSHEDHWLQKMQGYWDARISATSDGKLETNSVSAIVRGRRIDLGRAPGREPMSWEIEIGEPELPQRIILRAVLTPEQQAEYLKEHSGAEPPAHLLPILRGIIEVDRERIRLCVNDEESSAFPAQFSAAAGSSLVEFMRPEWWASPAVQSQASVSSIGNASPPVDPLATAWLDKLQGRWDVTISSKEKGESRSERGIGLVEGARFTVSGTDGSHEMAFDIAVGAAGNPQQVDLKPALSPEELAELQAEVADIYPPVNLVPVFKGIVDETSFGLRICLDGTGGHIRPTVFAASEEMVLYELKRPNETDSSTISSGNPADALHRAMVDAGHSITGVNLIDGRLEILGEVHDEAASQAAEDFARTLPGVKGVINALRVKVPADASSPNSRARLPNRNLSDGILALLKENNIPGAEEFIVMATGSGHVQIQGIVPSDDVAERVSRLVEAHLGVTAVDNYLQVHWPSEEELARWQAATVVVSLPNSGGGGFYGESSTVLGAGVVVSEEGLVITQLESSVDSNFQVSIHFNDGTTVEADVQVADADSRLYALVPRRKLTLDSWFKIAARAETRSKVKVLSPAWPSGRYVDQEREILRLDRRTPAVGALVMQLDGDQMNETSLRRPGRPVILSSGELAGMVVQGESRPADNICFALGPDELRRIFAEVLPPEVSKPTSSTTNPELDGVWISNVATPDQTNPEGPLRVVFWNGRQASFVGDKLHRLWTYVVDDSQNPRRLMLSPLNAEGQAMSGIYELKGDELRFLLWESPPPEKMEFVNDLFEFKRSSRDVPESLVTLMRESLPAASASQGQSKPASESETIMLPTTLGGQLVFRSSQEYGQRLSELQREIDRIPRVEQLVKEGLRPLADLEAARAAVKQMQILQDEYAAQIRLIELTLQEASEAYSVEQKHFSDAEKLQQAGAISSSEYDEQRLATRRAELAVQRLETLLTLYKSIGQPQTPPPASMPAPMPEPMPPEEAATDPVGLLESKTLESTEAQNLSPAPVQP